MPILDPSKRDVPVLGLIQAVQPGLYSEIVNQQQSGLYFSEQWVQCSGEYHWRCGFECHQWILYPLFT